jgi:hypothetical protein
MGTYTAYDLPQVDATVERHMERLKELCLARLGSDLNSLVLSGSFGRGEGSVLLHEDGWIEPLRDYDVRMVVEQPVPPVVLEQIRSEFMDSTGLGRADERFSGEQGFSITLEPLTREQLFSSFVRDCDLRAYDHLTASRIIYGKDYAPELRFPASDIPKVNGLRFLYQKMVGLVVHYARFRAQAGTGNTGQTLLYECDKTFIEICTALVLLAGVYVPSYRQRARLFSANWQTWFPELAKLLPELDDWIQIATWTKLYPPLTSPEDPDEAFEEASHALLVVHNFCVRKLYGLGLDPGRGGSKRLRDVLYRDYFNVGVVKWLGDSPLNNSLARKALNLAYHRLLRRNFAASLGVRGGLALREIARAHEAPPISIFIAAWCALVSVGDNPDLELLVQADEWLDRLPGMPPKPAHQTSLWERFAATSDRIARAYSIWEHSR